MKEIAFTIPVSGVIQLEGKSLSIKVNEAITTLKLESEVQPEKRVRLEAGRTLHDIVLETAQQVVQKKGKNEFTAAELYHEASRNYPLLDLKRNSWAAHVIASAPNHPSYHHYRSQRAYFNYLGHGCYRLE